MLRLMPLLVALTCLDPSVAFGDNAPFEHSLPLGKPERAERVRVEATAKGHAVLRVGGTRIETEVPAEAAWSATTVRLPGGRAVALLTAVVSPRRFGLVLGVRRGRAELLLAEELTLRGDPGERVGRRIDVVQRGTDLELVVGQFQEGVGVCGQPPALFDARRLDPASGTWSPLQLEVLPERPTSTDSPAKLNAQASAPVSHAPWVGRLRAVSSSQRTGPADVGLTVPPRALVDGSSATVWRGEPVVGGRTQFATLRWDASDWPPQALSIVVMPEGAPPQSAPALRAPDRLWLVGDEGAPVAVELPATQALKPGAAVWVALEKPWRGGCISVVFEGALDGEGAATGLAELRAYTELDLSAGGVDALLAELTGGGTRAAAAVELLAETEQPVSAKLLDAWPKLDARGRARAVRVFAGQARRDSRALDGLQQALESATVTSLRAEALAGLLAAEGPGVQRMRALVAKEGVSGDAAAEALARAKPAQAPEALLSALEAEGGAERAALRGALSLCARNATAVTELHQHFETVRDAGAEVAAALALAGEANTRPLATTLLLRNRTRVERFEDVWRLVLTAERIGEAAEIDAWLDALARSDERWMLREKALEVLAQRNEGLALPLARTLVADPYPRVRAMALGVLGDQPGEMDTVTLRARRDRWALVRVAALDALRTPDAATVMRAALTDRSLAARAASVRALTRIADRGAASDVVGRLLDEREWPEVQAAAVAYVGELCVGSAVSALTKVAERGLAPGAWDPHVELAMQALQALVRLGGDGAATARALARTQPGGERLVRALERAAGSPESACRPES